MTDETKLLNHSSHLDEVKKLVDENKKLFEISEQSGDWDSSFNTIDKVIEMENCFHCRKTLQEFKTEKKSKYDRIIKKQ